MAHSLCDQHCSASGILHVKVDADRRVPLVVLDDPFCALDKEVATQAWDVLGLMTCCYMSRSFEDINLGFGLGAGGCHLC